MPTRRLSAAVILTGCCLATGAGLATPANAVSQLPAAHPVTVGIAPAASDNADQSATETVASTRTGPETVLGALALLGALGVGGGLVVTARRKKA